MLFVNEYEAPELLETGGGPLVTARQAEEAATLLMERWPAVQTVVVTCMFGCVLRSAGRAEGGGGAAVLRTVRVRVRYPNPNPNPFCSWVTLTVPVLTM